MHCTRVKKKIRMRNRSERKRFFISRTVIPGYICQKCWLAVAISAGSGEPLCDCKDPICVPVNVVVTLPAEWWKIRSIR